MNMWTGIFIGGAVIFILSMLSPMAGVVLGPSANTLMMCKELERNGWLADKCFYDDGMLRSRNCKEQKPQQKAEAGNE